MATTLDWVKSLIADIRGDYGKGWNFRGREVGGKMVMQIDRNDENGRSTLLTNIGWRKDNKRNILNAIVEIKDYMYHNGDYDQVVQEEKLRQVIDDLNDRQYMV